MKLEGFEVPSLLNNFVVFCCYLLQVRRPIQIAAVRLT